jgi:pantothenate kinase type III
MLMDYSFHAMLVAMICSVLFCSASTIHNDGKDGQASDLDDSDPCDLLEAHVASQAHTLIFGEGNKKGCTKSVSQTAAKRDAPGISVFVVSSNPTMEHKICHMFKDVPAKLFKLRNTDFFSAEEGVYPTMGVDRVAALYGAKLHYGAPTLVIDGGTAMTYTMLDENAHITGGGISPGVKVRLQSLADYTGSLPTIDHLKFKTAVEGAIASKIPLPFFAKDTEMAMVRSVVVERRMYCFIYLKNVYTNTATCVIASQCCCFCLIVNIVPKISPVCAELSCQLRNIIKQYVARCQSSPVEFSSFSLSSSSSSTRVSPQGGGTAEKASATSTKTKRYPVIITGGDGKFLKDLLQADASNIIMVEPDATPIQAHAIELRNVKNLVTYALGDVIYEKFSQKPRNDPEEKLRLKIQGLRIAAPAIDQKEIFSRGCVFNITPESMIEGYVFHARFDNGTQKDLTLRELHGTYSIACEQQYMCVERRE